MTERAVQTAWLELTGAAFRVGWIDAGGYSTRYLEAGEGPPLFLLHGTGGHLEAYLRNIRGLARNFRVIAYDLVGHGYSSKPDKPYTLDVYVDQLHALMDAFGLDWAYLSGVSLGAWVAAWFAAQYPGRVRKVILNTPGNITSKPEVMAKLKDLSLRAVREVSYTTVKERLEFLFYNKELITDELVRIRLAIYSQPGFLKAMENIVVLQDPEVRRLYAWNPQWCSRIHAPTLILWTSHDPTGSIEEGKLLQSWIPGSEFVLVEEAGHWPQWEKPDEVNEIHRRFFLGEGKAKE